MLNSIHERYKDMSIPELEKEYNDLQIILSYTNDSIYCVNLMYCIKILIKELKDR